MSGFNPPGYSQGSFGVQRVENTSGTGKGAAIPDGVPGWSWGAFLLNWIWGLGNGTYIALLCLLPYVGFGFAIWMGIKGRELAWQNKRWDSVEHFNAVQRKWSVWSVAILVGSFLLGLFAALAIYGVHSYVRSARGV